MARTVFDCARVPGDTCSVQMTGERDHVVEAAKHHMIAVHDHKDGDALETNVKNALEEEPTPYASWV